MGSITTPTPATALWRKPTTHNVRRKDSALPALVLVTAAFTACGVRNDRGSSPTTSTNASTATIRTDQNPVTQAQVLLFSGTGTSSGDVAALETILKRHHVAYSTGSSSQLNRMSEPQMRAYRLLIIPGGNSIEIGTGLSSNTTATIRTAVLDGLNYLGICAGAFFAGNSPSNGLNLTSGIRFPFYAAEERGIRKAAVPVDVAEGPTLEHYWEDGPQLAGWGYGSWQISRRHSCSRGREAWCWLGDPHRAPPGSPRKLAAWNGVQYARPR